MTETTAAAPELALVSVTKAAVMISHSERTVRRWISKGLLPAYRVAGQGVRVDIADLRALVKPIKAGDF